MSEETNKALQKAKLRRFEKAKAKLLSKLTFLDLYDPEVIEEIEWSAHYIAQGKSSVTSEVAKLLKTFHL